MAPTTASLGVLEGPTGLRKAIQGVVGPQAAGHRGQGHTRETVGRSLPVAQQARWRRTLQAASGQPPFPEATAARRRLRRDLTLLHASAVAPLDEGLEEPLPRNRLGLVEPLGRRLTTPTCLESLMAQVGQWTDTGDRWRSSDQAPRWVATARLDIAPRLRRITGDRHRPPLRAALHK